MAAKLFKNLTILDAKVRFRNFEGKEGEFNPAGMRNFCIFLEDDVADELARDGWNIKWLKPKEPKLDPPQAYLKVSLNFDHFPPTVIAITSQGKTNLDEKTIRILDWAEVETYDVTISPYNWEVNGKTGIKAYLKKMYATLVEDELEKKYQNVPDSSASSLIEEGSD